MINNFNEIIDFLEYSPDGFYIMYVHRRPKDFGYEELHAFPSDKVIESPLNGPSKYVDIDDAENYFQEVFFIKLIHNKDDMLSSIDKAIKCAERHSGRVYVTAYRINTKKFFDNAGMKESAFSKMSVKKQLAVLSTYMTLDNIDLSFKMTDADGPFEGKVSEILHTIKCLCNCFDEKKVFAIPSRNGFHIISPQFPSRKLKQFYYGIYTSSMASVLLYVNF